MSDDVVAELDRWLGVPPIDDYEPIAIETVQRARDKIVELRAQLGAVKGIAGNAQRVGAEEMRERALEAARDGVRVAFDELRDGELIYAHDVIGCIEDAFASALPLTPEEPK